MNGWFWLFIAMSNSTLSIFLHFFYFLVPPNLYRFSLLFVSTCLCSHFVYSNIWIVLMGRTNTHTLRRCYRYGNVLSLISFHVDDNKMRIIMLSRFIYLQFQSHFQVLVLLFFCGLDARLLCSQAFLRSI